MHEVKLKAVNKLFTIRGKLSNGGNSAQQRCQPPGPP